MAFTTLSLAFAHKAFRNHLHKYFLKSYLLSKVPLNSKALMYPQGWSCFVNLAYLVSCLLQYFQLE